jgi:hypothetical protein
MSTWSDIEKYYNNELKKIANRCKEILEECIDSEVYDKYTPHFYERSYQLRDNVEVNIKGDYIYVYVNTGNMYYESNKPNVQYPASQWVPYWVNYGHNTDKGGVFMYDNYPSRNYIQVAKERIKNELGVDVEIIENDSV